MSRTIKLYLFFILLIFASPLISQEEGDRIYSSSDTYVILEKLGEGAFGEVFSVRNSANESFAIKSYKTDLLHPNKFHKDTEREFSRGQQLDHSNIVKTFDLFIFEASHEETTENLVLELVVGKTIAHTEKNAFSKKQGLNIAIQLVDALKYALSRNLMHMDLHGNNVMISDRCLTIKVIDLASFFTLDELIQNYEEKHGKPVGKALSPIVPQGEEESYPVAAAKLSRFFKQNPELEREILEAGTLSEAVLAKNNGLEGNPSRQPLSHASYRTFFSKNYFQRIVEICGKIIDKSTISAAEKAEIQTEISSLSERYQEDAKNGSEYPLKYYLKELKAILKQRA